MIVLRRLNHSLTHITAAILSLTYAWLISHTTYVTTGLQFVAPLLVMMLVHIISQYCNEGLRPGFAHSIYLSTAKTTIVTAGIIMIMNIFAPMPAQTTANTYEVINGLLTIAMCLGILSIILALIALAIFLAFKGLTLIWRTIIKKKSGPTNSRLLDVTSIVFVSLFLSSMSLEGIPNIYSFSTHNQSTASYMVAATPQKVWKTMETATSPKFPLPDILHIFPQPIAVLVDEGTSLHAKRIVKIKGREGEGNLKLKVIKRTENTVIFKVIDDTSPIANWVKHKSLSYTIFPEQHGTRLNVTLKYDRKLSPAWFFTPAIKLAAFFAMDVLARDTKKRAER